MEEPAITSYYDVLFYAAAWFIAAICGLLSTYLDNRHRDFWDLVAVGAASGFISVATIGLLCRSTGATLGSEPYYISISIFVGLLGKFGLTVTKNAAASIVESTLRKFGVEDGIHEVKNDEDIHDSNDGDSVNTDN